MSLQEILENNKKTARKFNSSTTLVTEEQMDEHMDDLCDLLSLYRAYPDVFIDDMMDDNDKYESRLSQRLMLRLMLRYRYSYITCTRGFSKSFTNNIMNSVQTILYPNSNLGELFNDYPNIKAFFTAFNTQITEFYNSIFTTDFEAKVQIVEFHVNYCGADTQDSNVIIIQYYINEENKTYTYKFYQNKVEAPNDAPEELTYIIEYAYNDYDNLAFYISYKSVGGNFQKMTELLNLISQIK